MMTLMKLAATKVVWDGNLNLNAVRGARAMVVHIRASLSCSTRYANSVTPEIRGRSEAAFAWSRASDSTVAIASRRALTRMCAYNSTFLVDVDGGLTNRFFRDRRNFPQAPE